MHPRPDFRRDLWLDLCGRWKFQFDDYEELKPEDMQDESAYELDILVPYPFQSKLSGVHDESHHDVVWYFREFKIPRKFTEKRVILKFGAVDYKTEVWLNGRFLGRHIGGYDPFSFEITDAVRDNNSLVLRIIDRHEDQPRGKQDRRLYPRGATYMRVTGIWQPVWLEFAGSGYIEEFKISPSIKGDVKVDVKLKGEVKGGEIKVQVLYYGAEVGYSTTRVKSESLSLRFKLDEVHLWTPEEPELYDIKLELIEAEEVQDRVFGYFGIREIAARDGRIVLNGKPIFLQMVLEQGYYPDGIYTPRDPGQFRKDLEAVKELGFNGVRAHQKPPDPRYLYYADKLGVLVWEEMGDWGMTLNEKNLKVFLQQWRNIIIRDYNHPCIIAWVPFNERSEPLRKPFARRFIKIVYDETKRLDPTRLVIDSSGWVHVKTDIFDIHDYSHTRLTGSTYLRLWKEYEKGCAHLPADGPVKRIPEDLKDKPIVISEFGGWGVKGQKPIVNRPAWAYLILEDSFEIERKYRDIVIAMANTGIVAGYCYTQLYDIEGELDGFLTYDRKWKVDPKNIREANKLARSIWLNKLSSLKVN